jgi:5-methylthioadenosine/S-adenosylhomocysteine deaminase
MNDSGEVIENGTIAIRDDKIFFVSKEGIVPPDFSTKNKIDAKGKLVMPGLINTHTHVGMSLLRNYADDLPLETWLFEKVFPIEDKFTAEDIYWASKLSMVEMIRTGTTTFADMYFFMEDVARAVEEAGMRANLSRGLQCFDDNFDASTDKRLNENKELYNNWNGKADGRIQVFVGPHSVYTCTTNYLKEVVNLAKELNTGIHIHLLETKKEARDSIKNFGCTAMEHCMRLGMFDVHTIAAHGVYLTDVDLEIAEQKKINIAMNPGSNLKLGSGIPRTAEILHKGINASLGTDGASSNNNLDMFEEIRLAALLSKGYHANPTLVNAEEALRMATTNGARALGIQNDVGTIKAGMKADLIIVDTNRVNYIPKNNIVSALAYSSNSLDVETVIVNGQVLMEHRHLKTLDEEKIIHEVEKRAKKLMK